MEWAIERLLRQALPRGAQDGPRQIVLDLDTTNDLLHGHQDGHFFHGFYDCY
jgi:hypothetical protein